jgi:hypothetical protein
MFIVMMAIAGIGFMIKYVLVPGFKRNEIYGRDVELRYLGLDRHQWGSIHLILGFLLLFLLFWHIVFHWRQTVCMYKNMVCSKAWRIVLICFIIFFSLMLGVMPLFVKPEITKGEGHHYYQNESSTKALLRNKNSDTLLFDNQVHEHHASSTKHENHSSIEINGKMTLREAAEKYSISLSELCVEIGIPVERANEKLGRLKKLYGFEMNDLREIIERKIRND